MGTFYRGNSLLSDPTFDHYLKGERRFQGTYVKITDPVNKYNKDFIEKVNDLNANFYKLVRANKIATVLINKYHSKAVETNNLMHLMISQSGTIRFNRVFKKALLKYGIKHQNIYDSIKKNIDKQYDRLKRNSKLIDMLLDDFGLTSLLAAVKDDTGLDFPDYIHSIEATFPVEKPIFMGEDNSEEENKWYDELTTYQINQIDKFIEEHNINVSGTISESLEKHRENLQAQRQEQKEEKAELSQQELMTKANNLIHDNCSHIQHDILAGYNEKHMELTPDEAYLLLNKVRALAKVCKTSVVYYIAAVQVKKRSIGNLQYAKQYILKSRPITENINDIGLYTDKKAVQDAYNELKEYRPNHLIKIQRILYSINSKYSNDNDKEYEYKDFYIDENIDNSGSIDIGVVIELNDWLKDRQRPIDTRKKIALEEAQAEEERLRREKAEVQRKLRGYRLLEEGRQRLLKQEQDEYERQRKLEEERIRRIEEIEQERIRKMEEQLVILRKKAEDNIAKQRQEAIEKMNDPCVIDKLVYEINNTESKLVMFDLNKLLNENNQLYYVEAISDITGKCDDKYYAEDNPFISINLSRYKISFSEWDPERELIKGARYFLTMPYDCVRFVSDVDYTIFMNKEQVDSILSNFSKKQISDLKIKVHTVEFNNPLLKEYIAEGQKQKDTLEKRLARLAKNKKSQMHASFNICKEKGVEEVYAIIFNSLFGLEYYDARLKKKMFCDRGSDNLDDISLYPELGRAQYELSEVKHSLKRRRPRTTAEIITIKVV